MAQRKRGRKAIQTDTLSNDTWSSDTATALSEMSEMSEVFDDEATGIARAARASSQPAVSRLSLLRVTGDRVTRDPYDIFVVNVERAEQVECGEHAGGAEDEEE